MRKECRNCKLYKTDYDLKKERFVKSCRAYPHITVLGVIEGLVNPNCEKFDPVMVLPCDRKSLKEKTLIRAGGVYDQDKEKLRSGIEERAPYKPLKKRR